MECGVSFYTAGCSVSATSFSHALLIRRKSREKNPLFQGHLKPTLSHTHTLWPNRFLSFFLSFFLFIFSQVPAISHYVDRATDHNSRIKLPSWPLGALCYAPLSLVQLSYGGGVHVLINPSARDVSSNIRIESFPSFRLPTRQKSCVLAPGGR